MFVKPAFCITIISPQSSFVRKTLFLTDTMVCISI